MTEDGRVMFKIASHLLQYPDAELRDSLEPLGRVIAELPPGRGQETLAELAGKFKNRSLIQWQEEYSRHFDLNPATCLNLTYHKYGDNRERGQALAELNQAYQRSGYEKTSAELPDFLPLVLEFLAAGPAKEAAWVRAVYQPQVETLAERLKAAGTSYAGLLAVVLDIWRQSPPKGGAHVS